MPRTRIKICGITRPEDAVMSAELGVHALGLNFVGGPRKLSLSTASDIVYSLARMPIAPIVVALCGSASDDLRTFVTAGQIGNVVRVGRFQVYGRAQAMLLNEDDSPSYWLVRPVPHQDAIAEIAAELSAENLHPQALLLDTASPDKLGGTGQTFNWHWIAEARAAGELKGLPPIILAGGLTPDNVAEAIHIARPYAVDVSSGVEVAGKPGIKDPIKMRDFIQAAQSA